jgi:hypothetical protein
MNLERHFEQPGWDTRTGGVCGTAELAIVGVSALSVLAISGCKFSGGVIGLIHFGLFGIGQFVVSIAIKLDALRSHAANLLLQSRQVASA